MIIAPREAESRGRDSGTEREADGTERPVASPRPRRAARERVRVWDERSTVDDGRSHCVEAADGPDVRRTSRGTRAEPAEAALAGPLRSALHAMLR